MRGRKHHPSSDAENQHSFFKWLEVWWGISFGNILTIVGGIVFALSLFFTFGRAFAENDLTDKQQNDTLIALKLELKEERKDRAEDIKKLETKLDNVNQNLLTLMIALKVPPPKEGP